MRENFKFFLDRHINTNNKFTRFLINISNWIVYDLWSQYKLYICIILITCGSIILIFIGILFPFLLSEKNMSVFYIKNPDFSDMIRIILEDRDNFENIFSPAAALFSGISSLAAVILLFWQINIVNLQRKDTNRAILDRWVYQMSLTKTEIIKEILEHSGQVSGRKAVHYFCQIIDRALIVFKDNDRDNNIEAESISFHVFYKYIKNASGDNMRIGDVVKKIDTFISKRSLNTLNSYFHNVYTTLKIIYDDRNITKNERQYYMRIYRSQFTQQELKIIYIHALIVKDDGELKFKNLIENTGFLHSLNKEFIPLEITEENFPGFGYSAGAFKS